MTLVTVVEKNSAQVVCLIIHYLHGHIFTDACFWWNRYTLDLRSILPWHLPLNAPSRESKKPHWICISHQINLLLKYLSYINRTSPNIFGWISDHQRCFVTKQAVCRALICFLFSYQSLFNSGWQHQIPHLISCWFTNVYRINVLILVIFRQIWIWQHHTLTKIWNALSLFEVTRNILTQPFLSTLDRD